MLFSTISFLYSWAFITNVFFFLSPSCPPSFPHNRLSTEYNMKATLRRVSDPLRCQHLWDAITTIRNHKQLPSFDRIRRYMSRMHNMESGKLFCCYRLRAIIHNAKLNSLKRRCVVSDWVRVVGDLDSASCPSKVIYDTCGEWCSVTSVKKKSVKWSGKIERRVRDLLEDIVWRNMFIYKLNFYKQILKNGF